MTAGRVDFDQVNRTALAALPRCRAWGCDRPAKGDFCPRHWHRLAAEQRRDVRRAARGGDRHERAVRRACMALQRMAVSAP